MNDKSLTTINHLLEGTPLVQQLNDIAKQVAKKLREEPLGYPDEMPVHQIRRRLKKAHEFDIITGDRLSMIDTLMDNAVEGKIIIDQRHEGYLATEILNLDAFIYSVLFV